MSLRRDTPGFISESQAKHGDVYDYSEAIYTGVKEKVKLLCAAHGAFFITPDNHLQGKGCRLCGLEKSREASRDTQATFLAKALAKHGKKYDYSVTEYVETKTKISIQCPKHGPFSILPSNHLHGAGCKKCADDGLRKPRIEFIAEAKKVHGEKYDYSQVVYQQAGVKVSLGCPQHGIFTIRPNQHLQGGGCRRCTYDARLSRWSARSWAEIQEGRLALLYVVKLKSESEEFYKVGITFQGLENRFKSLHAYTVEAVAVFESDNPLVVHQTEAAIKQRFKKSRYRPATPFNGHTECFASAEPILALLGKQNELIRQQ